MGQVVTKVAEVLDLVGKHEPCSLKQLTELTGYKKPALYLLLKSLVEVKYLDKNADGQYRLGDVLLQLTRYRCRYESAMQLVNAVAQKIAAELNESVTVSAIVGLEYHRLLRIDSRQTVKVNDAIIKDQIFYRSATGRVLLAMADCELRAQIISHIGLPDPQLWPDTSDYDTLNVQLDKISIAGLAQLKTVDGQAVFIAVPITSKVNGMFMSIGTNIPAFRFEGQHAAETVRVLTQASCQLNVDLQYT